MTRQDLAAMMGTAREVVGHALNVLTPKSVHRSFPFPCPFPCLYPFPYPYPFPTGSQKPSP